MLFRKKESSRPLVLIMIRCKGFSADLNSQCWEKTIPRPITQTACCGSLEGPPNVGDCSLPNSRFWDIAQIVLRRSRVDKERCRYYPQLDSIVTLDVLCRQGLIR